MSGEPREGEAHFTSVGFCRRLRAREPEAWEEVYAAFDRALQAAAHRILPARLDPEAAAQDAWVLAIRKIHRFDPDRELLPWLVTLCVNHCISVLRREHAFFRARSERRGREREGTQDPGHVGEDSRVRRGVARLPRPLQQILYLRYACEMGMPEVARALDLSESAARKRLSRAYAKLRAILDTEGGADG